MPLHPFARTLSRFGFALLAVTSAFAPSGASAAEVTGSVRTLNGLPVSQAVVRLASPTAAHEAVTGPQGEFNIDLPEGSRMEYKLEVEQYGVKRLVHVSAIGVATDAPSLYLRSKAAGEAALQAAGLALTLLQPSVIFGAEDRFMNLFASLQSVSPVMPLAGGDAQLQPVWVDDVAEAILRCLDEPRTIGRTYELAGPRPYALAELVRLAGRWAGHERPVVPLPMALGRLQAMALECLPGQPLMSRDNLRSLAVPNVKSADLPGLADLGIEAAALEAIAPGYLAPDAGRARFNPLRARARRD